MSGRAPTAAILVGLLVCSAVVGAGLAGVATDGAAAQADNETDGPEHVHPDDAGDGDEEATAGWLEARLGSMLGEGAIELSRGEYELAQQYVGEEYRQRLEQYVDVAGEEQGEPYDRTADAQARLAELLSEYRETLDAYQAARDRGDEERARELARELASLAERIEALGLELDRSFELLGEQADRNFTDARAAVNGTVAEVGNETARITEESFVATSLSVTADGTAIAADDPLRVEGQLTDEDGEPVANATIAVADPAGATIATTDAEGRFAVEHRPVLLPANATALSISYRPDPISPYAPATASLPVDIRQVQGTLAIDGVAGGSTADAGIPTVAFGDAVAVDVTARASGRTLADVPVRATLDGVSATATTTSSGTASPEPTVDVGVPAGERRLRVTVPLGERAITFPAAGTPVQVAETGTELTVAGEPGTDGRLTVTGRLATAAGAPVAGATIDLSVDGTPATTVRTDGDGRFATTVDAPAGADSVPVVARFEGASSNLDSARSEDAVAMAGGGGTGDGAGGDGDGGTDSDGQSGIPLGTTGLAIVLLVVGFAAFVAGWIGYRRWWTGGGEPGGEAGDAGDAASAAAASRETILADARERLADDPGASTALAYGVARSAVAERGPADDGRTHREFLAACAADGLEDAAVDELRTLTDRYEAAVYDPAGIDVAGAREALDAAEALS